MRIAVEQWMEEPLRRFIDDSRVRLVLLLETSGRVLAQHGFTRSLDVMSACALAAAIHASSGELGRQLEGRPFRGLHHAGRDRQLFLAEAQTQRGSFIVLTVFDQESSLGLVRMYFDEFARRLAAAAPPPVRRTEPVLEQHFERDLNKNLATLFGRA